jgi:2-polyprenyl-3-methyl-5-hydroxy-6-metoxy-1,4-benzoquinol methylase
MTATAAWFDGMYGHAALRGVTPDLLQHIAENRDRIIATVDVLRPYALRGKRVCELGPGGVGLAVKHELGAEVVGYDYSDWSRDMCDRIGIEWRQVDLHQRGFDIGGPYDAILMCEVIEHLARWPAEILGELREALAPGGVLMVTTQNLHRLAQRVRMLRGRPLFAAYVPEQLVMAHLREYTPEELEFLFRRAGFESPTARLFNFTDVRRGWAVRQAHLLLCRLAPRLSSFVFCWAQR